MKTHKRFKCKFLNKVFGYNPKKKREFHWFLVDDQDEYVFCIQVKKWYGWSTIQYYNFEDFNEGCEFTKEITNKLNNKQYEVN